ncbi:riboflavin biosynthesis protein RibF [Pontiella sulfatireligans]|uniref:Riboflavin biosynthesis protein n=1 Tax=Pontiella sulfatireligans TaxID=2750658 RepID=A0A6C2UL03_9BACT|nr:riboflavin biosynthesis protein RibF [Pontiella sulfatireligans]VGO20573.1 Riboflavin biosynthesis protein RibF [Pontiella sulfatireligans]
MKIIHALEEFSDTQAPVILAAGCFDGLHIGHSAVIQVAIDHAQTIGGEAWVFTFDPHPAKVLSPDRAPPLIFTTGQQSRQLQEMGVGGCILQPFTIDFMKQEPVDFFDNLCSSIPELAGISVGEDWSFGRNRSGNPELLTKLCGERNMFFSAHPSVCWKEERVSSTRIREAVKLGRLEDASGMLGRPVSTIGKVVHGEKIGRGLGYPTANIEPENDILPPRGIYASQLRVGHNLHNAAAYIGHRGTFHENKLQVLEVHLLDETDIDLYGQQVEVSYLKYIRGDEVFENAEKLKKQIVADLQAIRSVFP